MICVLILFILTAVTSVPQSNNCQEVSYLEQSEVVMAFKMTNKNATLHALCRWLIDYGIRTPTDAQRVLNATEEDIWDTYHDYDVSIIRKNA